MKKIATTLLLAALVVTGCKSNEEKDATPTETTPKENTAEQNTFAVAMEKAHQKDKFSANEAVQFDIQIMFGGKERMNATFTTLTNSTQSVIEYKDGSKIVINNDKVAYSPTIANEDAVRFDAYTWNYFFLFPYKVNDPGTIWTAYDNKEADSANYLTEKLTFKSGTGDAPDDWYVVYADKKTNLLEKAAYIVTMMGGKEAAEKNPHAIKYMDYKEVDGVPIATKWIFTGWKEGTGLTDQLGEATLSNIHFVKVNEDTFKIGEDFKTK